MYSVEEYDKLGANFDYTLTERNPWDHTQWVTRTWTEAARTRYPFRLNSYVHYFGQDMRLEDYGSFSNFKAYFVPGAYISVSPNFANRGIVSPFNNKWYFKERDRWPISYHIYAVAAEGYVFKNWTLNGEVVSTESHYTLEVTPGDSPKICHYVANFVVDEYRVTVDGSIIPQTEGCTISPQQITKVGSPGETLDFTFEVSLPEHHKIKCWTHNGKKMKYKERKKTFSFEVYDHDTHHDVVAEIKSAHWHVGTGLPAHGEDGQLLHSEDGQIYYDSDRWIYAKE